MPAKKDRWFLKEILDLKQLRKIFQHFSIITNLDVALYDLIGHEITAVRKAGSVCHSARNRAKCRNHIKDGSQRSSELGEPYICSCGCGLVMCFSPVVYKEQLIGSIACGPAVLWDADEVAMKEFLEKTLDMRIQADIQKLFRSITSCTCANMTSSAQILFIIVNSLTREHSVYLEQRAQITEQQAKIAELISNKKNRANSPGILAGSGDTRRYSWVPAVDTGGEVRPSLITTTKSGNDYPIERERELIACVQKGNAEQSGKILNMLLGEIFTFADGNRDAIKLRLFELVAFFSRAAIANGAPMSEINKIVLNSYEILRDDLDFEHVCFLICRIMEDFICLIRGNHNSVNLSEYLSKAVNYMMVNYSEELTLEKVSDVIFISSFYLSHLFRREMNTTFSDYLCKIRIEKAKGLLKNEKDPRIQDIAGKTGFNDPNYFAKTFKKIVGVAPRDYKKFFT